MFKLCEIHSWIKILISSFKFFVSTERTKKHFLSVNDQTRSSGIFFKFYFGENCIKQNCWQKSYTKFSFMNLWRNQVWKSFLWKFVWSFEIQFPSLFKILQFFLSSHSETKDRPRRNEECHHQSWPHSEVDRWCHWWTSTRDELDVPRQHQACQHREAQIWECWISNQLLSYQCHEERLWYLQVDSWECLWQRRGNARIDSSWWVLFWTLRWD